MTVSSRIDRPQGPHFGESAIWCPDLAPDADVLVAFRADLELASSADQDGATDLVIELQAAGNFRLWVDGAVIGSGPLRYAAALPEFDQHRLRLPAGTHRLAIMVAGGGLVGRMTPGLPSFLWVRVTDSAGTPIPLTWRCRRLDEFAATGLRSSPLLDRLEWLDRPLDPSWISTATDDHWQDPVPATGLDVLGPSTPGVISLSPLPAVVPTELGRGRYRESFTGYRYDDPAMQFLLADLAPPAGVDHDGSWVRYDLGRIRIGHLELTVESDSPAEVIIGYADRLDPRGLVAPVVALSTGPTRMIQRYAVAAGSTRLEPFGALGGRYVEVRTTGDARIRDAAFRDRDFLGPPRGEFGCDDPVLDRIWQVGLDTLRACAEDVLIDSIRERGEWVGDVMASAVDLLAVGWGDQRLVHRALLHAAACARDDGLVAGCVPGEPIYVGTYAAQWLNVCLQVAETTADDAVLVELEEAGRANVAALLAMIAADGSTTLPWNFVDWGHAPEPGRPDTASLLHVLRGLDAWLSWQRRLGRPDDDHVRGRRDQLAALLQKLITGTAAGPDYHVATLACLAGLLPGDQAVPAVHDHLRRGFPFEPAAPRLRDPGRVDPSVVTPYFTNYSMPVLLDAGRTDDVLDLWRRGWGWMLDQGATTWWEVFDDRWSQCHFWSGAPTWQLTRYVLGARISELGGEPGLIIRPAAGSLDHARGVLPIGTEDRVELDWQRSDDELRYTVITDRPLPVSTPSGTERLGPGRHTLRFPA